MQINLTNDDMAYLVGKSNFSKSRIAQILRKANKDIFLMIVDLVKNEGVKSIIDEKDITEGIYKGYGSFTGVLFGIPSSHRQAVETIVRLTIEQVKGEA